MAREAAIPDSRTEAAAAPVTVTLPERLTALFPGAVRRLEVRAASVAEAIDRLDARWPGMRDRLCDSTPKLRKRINVFVEGKRVALETPLSPGATVHIMTAICEGG